MLKKYCNSLTYVLIYNRKGKEAQRAKVINI